MLAEALNWLKVDLTGIRKHQHWFRCRMEERRARNQRLLTLRSPQVVELKGVMKPVGLLFLEYTRMR